jgi:hypothetical protein
MSLFDLNRKENFELIIISFFVMNLNLNSFKKIILWGNIYRKKSLVISVKKCLIIKKLIK